MENVYTSPILVVLFLSMAASIVIFQLIPALIIFFSMMRGIFTTKAKI